MQYNVEYQFVGADDSGLKSKSFEAADDEDALRKAPEIVEGLETRVNERIQNPYWHWAYKMRSVFRVEKEILKPLALWN